MGNLISCCIRSPVNPPVEPIDNESPPTERSPLMPGNEACRRLQYTAPPRSEAPKLHPSLSRLVELVQDNRVSILFCDGDNPILEGKLPFKVTHNIATPHFLNFRLNLMYPLYPGYYGSLDLRFYPAHLKAETPIEVTSHLTLVDRVHLQSESLTFKASKVEFPSDSATVRLPLIGRPVVFRDSAELRLPDSTTQMPDTAVRATVLVLTIIKPN